MGSRLDADRRRFTHDRMPVIIQREDWPIWLGEVAGHAADLLHPPPDELTLAWPVGQAINSPRNNGPELLVPTGELVP